LEDYELVFEPDTQSLGDACKGACYSTGTTRELTQRYGDLHGKINDLEAAIANTVSRKLITLLPALNKATLACAELDCILSLAEIATNHAMCRPDISSEKDMEIIEGRNLIVEQRTAAKYIPNDTLMGSLSSNSKRQADGISARVHVVTGPNASGKTCYLKQIGVISFLAHIGSFVPAKVRLMSSRKCQIIHDCFNMPYREQSSPRWTKSIQG
jgi:DNA mismatch repair protein MSH5